MGCFLNMSDIKLYNGECLEVMSDIDESSVDLILCDYLSTLIAAKFI